MKKQIVVILLGFLVLLAVGVGISQAGGDNNQHTHGEESNYEENNSNPFGDDEFPGDESQQRSGVVWP
jgi:hypothetical protein